MRPKLLGEVALVALIVSGLGTQQGALAAPEAGPIFINFDGAPASCVASDTTALRDDYVDLGVLFKGPAPLDGGGIFDACANFGVEGFSPPNFLGFAGAEYADGGTARGPETILFLSPMSHVEFTVAHGIASPGDVYVLALDGRRRIVDRATMTLSSILTLIAVDGPSIRAVRITVVGPAPTPAWVMDDLFAS